LEQQSKILKKQHKLINDNNNIISGIDINIFDRAAREVKKSLNNSFKRFATNNDTEFNGIHVGKKEYLVVCNAINDRKRKNSKNSRNPSRKNSSINI